VAVHVTSVAAGAGDGVIVERSAAVQVRTESVYVLMA
jgi:hypothetical protein